MIPNASDRSPECDGLPDFLRGLPVSPEVCRRLSELGAADAATLLGMIRATPTAFDQWLGAGVSRRVAESLEARLGPEDLETLATPGPAFPTSGANVDRPAPEVEPFLAALQERDRLHAAWRNEASPGRRHILEQQLEVLLQPPPAVSCAHPSPVDWLLPYLASAPFRAAPERAGELHAVQDEQGIRLRFVDEVDTVTAVDLGAREVLFGLALAERLWLCSYACLELLRLGASHGPGEPTDLPLRARLAVEAVRQAETRGGRPEWPQELPRPDPKEAVGPVGLTANELFLAAGALALLHGIGHIVRGHRPDAPHTGATFREYEADDWAAGWMLDRWRDYGTGGEERVFVRRSLGSVVCVGHLAALESQPRTGVVPLPNPAQRLLHHFDHHLTAAAGLEAKGVRIAWEAAVLMVDVQMHTIRKVRAHEPEGTTAREFLETASQTLSGDY
jgi:hypothetical protein